MGRSPFSRLVEQGVELGDAGCRSTTGCSPTGSAQSNNLELMFDEQARRSDLSVGMCAALSPFVG
jgi:hypothetical protein